MKRKRFTDEQIVAVLHEASSETPAREVARRHGGTETTLCWWRAKYGAMQQRDVRRLKRLEDENRRHKGLVADLPLDVAMLARA